jgi:membrane-associated protein
MEFLIEVIRTVLNPNKLINLLLDQLGIYVYLGLAFIIFAETGLAVGFFLPGDSLLVVAGLFAAAGKFDIFLLITVLFIASVLGDSTGYFTGSKIGHKLFTNEKSIIFRPSYVKKAHVFFEKYGAKTVILARFVPIVRTFAPIVAGAADMPYLRFLPFSLLGSFLWIFSMVLLGYFVGGMVETALGIKLEEHIEKVVITVVALSLAPPIIEFIRARFFKSHKKEAETPQV